MQKIFIGCAPGNFQEGREGNFKPEAIVIHIGEGSLRSIDSQFKDPRSSVSAHYCVGKLGQIHQYVEEINTAFHAGNVDRPSWPLIKPGEEPGSFINPNFYTIGIEHEGFADDVWPETQLAASAALVGEIAQRWQIPLDEDHVVRHHQIRFSKPCPGNFIKIPEILKRVPAAGGRSTTITSVKAVHNLHLRTGMPSLSAPVDMTVPAQTILNVSAVFQGDTISGNSNWYADGAGHFFWAGDTDQPHP
jgi:N-acetylmuramoyl-L-alanine amidase